MRAARCDPTVCECCGSASGASDQTHGCEIEISKRTLLNHPVEIPTLTQEREPSFWDAVQFWPLLAPSKPVIVRRFFCTVYYTPQESGYTKRILDNRNNTLVPRLSAAVHRRNLRKT
jgi:hypothetical protein